MKSIRVITNQRTTQGGDGRDASVTLFSLLLVAVVTGSFLYAYRYLRPVDHLVSYVPADATAYVHFRTLHPDMRERGYALFDIPVGLAPDEIASFRTIDADGKGHWSTIFAWDNASHITTSERGVIAATWVSWLDEKTFVIPDDQQDTSSVLLAVHASGNSIDAGSIGNGLRQMRSIAPVQGYLKSLALPDDAPSTSTIFGTVFDDAGISMTLVMPTNLIPKEKPLLGLDVRNGAILRPQSAMTSIELPGAATVQRRFSGNPAEPSIILDGLAEAIKNYGSPSDASFKGAINDLFGLLRPPFTLSIDNNGDSTVLHLPLVSAELLTSNIDRFLTTVFPPKRDITLPDGTVIQEFYRGASSTSSFVTIGHNTVWPMRVDPSSPSGLNLFITPDSTATGSILSTSQEALEAAKPLSQEGDSGVRCGALSTYADEILTLQDVTQTTKRGDLFTADPIARLGLKKAVLLRLGDGLAVICEYSGTHVDK